MATPSLSSQDYKAIGQYAEQHELRLRLSVLPYVYFIDAEGVETKKLLSHIHGEVDEEKQTGKRKK